MKTVLKDILTKQEPSRRKREANEDVDIEDGVEDQESPKRLRRSNSANTQLGLTVLLHTDSNEYEEVALNNFYGFRVGR